MATVSEKDELVVEVVGSRSSKISGVSRADAGLHCVEIDADAADPSLTSAVVSADRSISSIDANTAAFVSLSSAGDACKTGFPVETAVIGDAGFTLSDGVGFTILIP